MAIHPAIVASATKRHRNAYSTRSCPSSSETSRQKEGIVLSKMKKSCGAAPTAAPHIGGLGPAAAARRGQSRRAQRADLRADVAEQRVDADAERVGASRGNKRDEDDQERVLDEVLAVFLTN